RGREREPPGRDGGRRHPAADPGAATGRVGRRVTSSPAKWGVNYAEVTLAGNSQHGCGERRNDGSGERRLPSAVLNLFAFLFGEAPPDTDVLPGGKCPIQTATPHAAVIADPFGRFDLL